MVYVGGVGMIWLPGILSQGGEKYVWNRYSIAYTETAGSSATVSRTYSYSKMAASAYSRSGTTFTLTSPASTTFENITAGEYLVNVANSSSTATSGTTLYKVTNNSGRSNTIGSSGETSNYSYAYPSSSSTMYYWFAASINSSGRTFDLTSRGSTTPANVKNFPTYVYSPYRYFPTGNFGWTMTGLNTIYRLKQTSVSSDGLTVTFLCFKCTIEQSDELSITYTPYTAIASAGTLIDTVEDKDPAAYPTNGIQDGYWYVLQS